MMIDKFDITGTGGGEGKYLWDHTWLTTIQLNGPEKNANIHVNLNRKWIKILLRLTLLYFLQNYFTILKRFLQNGNLVIVQQKKKTK